MMQLMLEEEHRRDKDEKELAARRGKNKDDSDKRN